MTVFVKRILAKVKFLPILGIFLVTGCGVFNSDTAILWTDRPEFAFYADSFNRNHDKYKIEVHYMKNVAENLYNSTTEKPDIIAGSWLKSASTLKLWRNLDFVFSNNTELQNSFYQPLLELGRFDDRQCLLPVSFNLPLMIFSGNNSRLITKPFTIDINEIQKLGIDYNEEKNGVLTREGFSPLWNNEFLFQTATLFDVSFKELGVFSPGDPLLGWNDNDLEKTIKYIRDWIEKNGGLKSQDDFFYKYFFDPPQKLSFTGRILFAYMKSSDFFTLANQSETNLDFRMLASDNIIHVSEDAVYYGIYKKGRAKKIAEIFTRWFFTEATQELLLKENKEKHLSDSIFGIGNGFSAMRTVTEQVFPLYYPALLGHIPPEDYLASPNILPKNWPDIKERVILPYLREECRETNKISLEQRLSAWLRVN
jgi:hypothetical protein